MASPAEINELLQRPLQLGRGRRSVPVNVAYKRPLEVADLVKASSQPHEKAGGIVLELRQTHHHIARLVAKGAKNPEISAITGLTPGRISTLRGDPAFVEIVAYYTDLDDKQYEESRANMHERLAALGFDSLQVLHARVLDKPDEFDNKTLLAVVEAAADRTGHGKTSTVNHEHEHALSANTIAALKADVNSGRALAPADRGALLRLAAERTAEEHPAAEEADWIEGSGSCIREEVHSLDEAPVQAGTGEVS